MTPKEELIELKKENQALKRAIGDYRKLLFDRQEILERDRVEIQRIAKKHGVGVFEILSGARARQIVLAKQEIALFFKNKNYTYSRIAKILNVESHSSIIYLCNKKKPFN